jgi:hypothetical protein
MAKAPAKRLKAKTKLPAKKRKELVEEIRNEEYNDVTEDAIERLWAGLQFEHYEKRQLFFQLFSNEPHLSLLHNCARVMQSFYKKLLKKFCVGKHYLEMQQAWFMSISLYFDTTDDTIFQVNGIDQEDKLKLQKVWADVMITAKELKCDLADEDQRIIVSTLAYIVYDMMTMKVKDKKEITLKNSQAEQFTVHENLEMLYRYAGAALHSMIEKRKKLSSPNEELKILYALKIKKEDCTSIPSQIDSLNNGGLVVISPRMIPFINELMVEINKLINDAKLQLHGKQMISKASEELKANDDKLKDSFKICLTEISAENYDESALNVLETEIVNKIFHARVKEFLEARKEINLEKSGKITDAEQSLRDTLKTYSVITSRSM